MRKIILGLLVSFLLLTGCSSSGKKDPFENSAGREPKEILKVLEENGFVYELDSFSFVSEKLGTEFVSVPDENGKLATIIENSTAKGTVKILVTSTNEGIVGFKDDQVVCAYNFKDDKYLAKNGECSDEAKALVETGKADFGEWLTKIGVTYNEFRNFLFSGEGVDERLLALMNNTTSSKNDGNSASAIATPTPEPQTTNEYSSGMYKIGVDMPAGQYMLINKGSSKAYFALCADANCDDIIENDNFSYNSIVTAQDGDYLDLSRCSAYPFDEYTNVVTDGEGLFLVGRDIPAGEYKIEVNSEGSKGYYALLADTRERDIISNDNFEGSRYIDVKDGQYLELSRCHLVK
ncbi:MAG: hypothetical protein RR916_07495 [Anaerorhabdus sp.]